MGADGPRVLILGGCGFIGRNLVHYIVSYDLASFVRVADKVLPSMAYLSDEFKTSFEKVDFVQANLSDDSHVERAFEGGFNLVVNLAAETRYGMMEMLYEKFIYELRVKCATKAAALGVDKYIEVSTAQVYDPDAAGSSGGAKETAAVKPWTMCADFHLRAEQAIARIRGLKFVILRLPIVYGPGDRSGLMPRLICAALYQHTGEKMEFLWNESLRINTVHVQDVAGAIWYVLCSEVSGETFNLVDDNDTTQGKLNKVLESMFRIKTGFVGSIMSNLAKLKLDTLVEEANEGHLEPWVELCSAEGIGFTPLSPIIDKELLYNNPLAIDGGKIKSVLGFQCSCPELTKDLLVDSMEYWQRLKLFPSKF